MSAFAPPPSTDIGLLLEDDSPELTLAHDWAPGILLSVALVVGAVALTWLAARAKRARAFERIHMWIGPVVVLTWTVALSALLLRFLDVTTMIGLAARLALLVTAAVIALPLLRDVLYGVVMAFEGRHSLGDDIKVLGLEGRITEIGLRSLVLRARDGTEASVPHRRLAGAEVIRLNLEAQDAPSEFEFEVPPDTNVDELMEHAREAAMLSPFASPGSVPEVYVVASQGDGHLKLHVRGYVFDRAHDERYRGDVIARVGAAMRGEHTRRTTNQRAEPPAERRGPAIRGA